METYGFNDPNFVTPETLNKFKTSYTSVLQRRYGRWQEVINQGNLVRSSHLKRFCRKGVPPDFRAHVWMSLSGAYEEMKSNPTVYSAAAELCPIKDIYTTILGDLPRTFPENFFFTNATGSENKLNSLRRILSAFAVTFPKIGYCQGLNYVAATILLALTGPLPEVEEKTFWLLHALTHRIVPDYYIRGMVDVQVDCLVFEELLKQKDASVYKILHEANVDCIVLATKWFICLFADVVPIETVLRIFDCLFYEGDKILFRACIALVKLHHQTIVKCQLFPDVLLTFRQMCQDRQTLYCHEFLQSMFKLPGTLSKVQVRKLREKCLKKVICTMEDLDRRQIEYNIKQAQENEEKEKSADSLVDLGKFKTSENEEKSLELKPASQEENV